MSLPGISHIATTPRGRLNIKMSSYHYRDPPILNIRRSHDCLIFNMGIPISGKDGLYIETGPWSRNKTVSFSPSWPPPASVGVPHSSWCGSWHRQASSSQPNDSGVTPGNTTGCSDLARQTWTNVIKLVQGLPHTMNEMDNTALNTELTLVDQQGTISSPQAQSIIINIVGLIVTHLASGTDMKELLSNGVKSVNSAVKVVQESPWG